jgi:hypothetical protein
VGAICFASAKRRNTVGDARTAPRRKRPSFQKCLVAHETLAKCRIARETIGSVRSTREREKRWLWKLPLARRLGTVTTRSRAARNGRQLESAADAKNDGQYLKYRDGARSAAGRMTALSLGLNVRGHGFQMHHYRDCARDPLKN